MSITPNKGTDLGGTSVTIYGDGFYTDQTNINFGLETDFNSKTAKISYDTIIFKTWAASEGDYLIKVIVNNQDSVCNTNCTFTISSNYTPIINTILPNTVNDSNTEIVINGLNFGNDTSKIRVDIGSQNCLLNYADDSIIRCILNGLDIGDQIVQITTGNYLKEKSFRLKIKTKLLN